MSPGQVSVSVVSHGQRDLVGALLADLNLHCRRSVAEVLVTENVREGLESLATGSSIPVRVVSNARPKGFGANHNRAFRLAQGNFFCVANPDIRLRGDPYGRLIACMKTCDAALAAPRVLNEDGALEDSARVLPTPYRIFKKALGVADRLDYPASDEPFFPEWTAGMFMLFKTEAFDRVGGFDEGYHLYYEDVDICARLRLSGHRVVSCPEVAVTHAARRESHRNLRYLKWHLKSMLRFFTSPTYFRYRRFCREHGRGGVSS